MGSWDDFNKQFTEPQAEKEQTSAWSNFNAEMTEKAYSDEARLQGGVDKNLFKIMKQQGVPTKEIKTLEPQKTPGFFSELKDTYVRAIESKPMRGVISAVSLYGRLGQNLTPVSVATNPLRKEKTSKQIEEASAGLFGTVRGTSQLVATPLAGGMAKVFGGATPKAAMKESLDMAKRQFLDKDTEVDEAVEKGAQMYLKSKKIGKYGGEPVQIKDVAAIGFLGFANIFGDPLFEFGMGLKGAQKFKEFTQFKKTGTAVKELEAGTQFVRGKQIERVIDISDDLRLKIKPKTKEIVFEGYQRRFPKQKEMPLGKMADDAQQIVMSTREATGMEIAAKFQGDDLILRPTVPVKGGAPKPVEVKKQTQIQKEYTKEKQEETPLRKVLQLEKDLIAKSITGGLKDQRLKAVGFEYSALERKLKGEPTYKESQTARKRLESNYVGKLISVDGKNGKVVGQSFGKIRVDFDGQVKSIDVEDIDKTKVTEKQVLDYLKKEATDKIEKGAFAEEYKQFIQDEKIKTQKQTQVQPQVQGQAKAPTELITPKVSRRVEQSAVEAGLVKDLGRLPQMEKMNMKAQASMATELLNNDLAKLKRIVLSGEETGSALRQGSAFTALKNYAVAKGDVDLITQLARSDAAGKATMFGQEIKAFDDADPFNPVRAIQKIEKARAKKQKIEKTKAEIQKEVKNITREEKLVKKHTKDLEDFISNIKC